MSLELELPNVRKIFVPDPGYTLFDADLSGADAQVVAWEADDEDLKAAFRAGLDVHSKNAEDMFGTAFTRLEGVARKAFRDKSKRAVHATNYLGSARSIAKTNNWTMHEAESFIRRWLSIHPAIARWHKRIERALNETKSVRNVFGFPRVYFERPNQCLPAAIAWIPQSTVALNTYHGAFQLRAVLPEVEFLLQVHDSLVFQIPNRVPWKYAAIVKALRVKTPYADPLYIPWGLAVSEISWGDCKEVAKEKLVA